MSRISSLPRRDWESEAEIYVETLTEEFRTPSGCMRLRPIQAIALAEMCLYGGLFGSIAIGGGKTLISALAASALGCKRPVLIVPAKLHHKDAAKSKTIREINELRKHWKIPIIKVKTYSQLGTDSGAKWLEQYQPDGIICDEAHALKNYSERPGRQKPSAVGKRVARYLDVKPATKFVGLTGTIARDSILDYAHLIKWALRLGAPVPLDDDFIQTWAACLDVKSSRDSWQDFERPDFKVLVKDLGPVTNLEDGRRAYSERLRATPGVIISGGGYRDVPLIIEPTYYPPIPSLDDLWLQLRRTWVAPDGYPLGDSKAQVWAMARDLAFGFYKRHDPWPPDFWLAARKEWLPALREVLEDPTNEFDTEGQVKKACKEGRFIFPAYDRWMQVEPKHKITRVVEWLDYSVLEWLRDDVLRKMSKGGIIWTTQTALAKKLEELYGWVYYGEGGLNSKGQPIEKASGSDIVIASVKANGTGRNLQYQWNNNYVTSLPPGGPDIEQMVGRTYRSEQPKSHVNVWYGVGCREHHETWRIAKMQAEFSNQTTKLEFAILTAQETALSLSRCKGPAYI